MGLERATQKAVEELIEMKLLTSNSKDEANVIKEEPISHEEQIMETISELSEDIDIGLDVSKVEETAKETEKKAIKIMNISLSTI